MIKHCAWLGALLLVITSGCKKDADGTAPSVEILSPVAGYTLAIPGTVTVRAVVSDDRQVTSVVMLVADALGVPIGPSEVVEVNEASATVERTISISDERLLSGTYTIVVRASDGTNDGRGFREIHIQEAPLRLRSIFLAPPNSVEAAAINRIDSTGTFAVWAMISDLNGAGIDSRTQHLMLAGSQVAPFSALPTAPWSNSWSVSPVNNDVPEQFTGLSVDPKDGRTYFAIRNGQIRGYTGEGAPRFTAFPRSGHRCTAIVRMGDRVVTWQKAIASNDQQLVSYATAGTVLETMPITGELVQWYERGSESMLAFTNVDGLGRISDVNLLAGGTPVQREFSEGPLRAVARLGANTYVLALPDRLVRYDRTTNVITQIASGVIADALAFDPVFGNLLVAQGAELFLMDPTNGSVTGSFSNGGPIGYVLPLYNR